MKGLKVFERVALPLAIGVVAISTFFVHQSANSYENAHEKAKLARVILAGNQSLLSALKDAERGQRGFLITGDDSDLEPYHRSLAIIHNDLNELKTNLTDAPHVARLAKLEDLIQDKLSEMERTIAIRKTQGFNAAAAIVEQGAGKRSMDDIRIVCDETDQSVREPMLVAQQSAEQSASNLRWWSIGSLLLLLVLLSIASFAIHRATQRRERLIKELAVSKEEAAVARDTLELTMRSIGDAVIATDHEGRVRFMNSVAQRLTGWIEENAGGQPLSSVFRIVNERTRDTVESPVEKVLRLGTVVGLANHTLLISASGEEIPIDDSAAPIRNAQGKIDGVVLVFRDITERHRAEKELEKNRSELTRTNEALQRSNTDLEQFAYAVSHDLQAPLRTIASFSQLIVRGGGSDPKTAEYVRYIESGVGRMMDLIRDLLEYSRVTHEKELAPAAVDFQEVLGEVLWNLQAQITDTGAAIKAGNLPTVMADKRSMVQLLQNLVSNALKYNTSGRPEVKIEAASRGNSKWVFHVRDNGIGIDMRHAEQIFGVFTRLHGKDQYSGTGIGLAICRRIVELHGGAIWVESQPGQGSTFSFTLPSLETENQQQQSVAQISSH